MDRLERKPDPTAVAKRMFAGWQAGIWTALPAVVVDYDPAKLIVSARPTIQALVTGQKGVQTWVTLPVCTHVPVLFQGGGGFGLTFPIQAGDECLLIFSSRCIDAWWQQGGTQRQMDFRMHDLSDAFALVGVRSQAHLPGVVPSTTHVELRADDGTALVRITNDHKVQIVATGTVDVTAPTINLTGHVVITGDLDVSGHVTGEGTDLHTHIHSGVDAGSSNSGPPV